VYKRQNQGSGYYPGTNVPNNNNNNNSNNYYSQPALVPQFSKDQQGIVLAITPSVARNSDVVTLKLSPTVREKTRDPQELEFTSGTGPDGRPITNKINSPPEFSQRSLTTTLHIKNGETVALGGLTSERSQQAETGMPMLSRIPLLGRLFRNDSRSNERRNLVILVTASIVDPSGAKVGDEIARLRDTARILVPSGQLPGDIGRTPEEPQGPAAPKQKRVDPDAYSDPGR
jgi:type II secretory pathway component GspD/PulD (secretin)